MSVWHNSFPPSLTNTCGRLLPVRSTRYECLCMYKSNHTCMFLRVCTYTLPTSPFHVHLWGDPGTQGKNTQGSAAHTTILSILHLWECDTILFHPPSQTPVVAYFLSGLKGKNAHAWTSLTTHVFSYVCALTHFPPLPSMTTCEVILVTKVRLSRELHI